MNVKRKLVFLFYLFKFIETSAQCESSEIGLLMDGSFTERGHTVVRSNQGGLMLGGITSGGFGSGDWFITKLNSANTIEWCKHIGTSNNNETGDNLLIQPINTGGYIIAGYQLFGGSRVLVYSRIDENGNVIWTRLLEENNAPGETAADIIQLMDGNFIIVGTTNTYSSGSSDGFAFKFDIDGNVFWANAYGNGPNEHFYSCLELPNGDLVCTGEAINGGAKGWVVKLDPQGNLFYSKTLNTAGYSLIMDCKLSSSNTIFCTGLESYLGVNKLMIMSFETNETINYAHVIIGDNNVTVGSNIELHSTGDLMITGVKGNSFANENQPFFLRTNSSGIPMSSKSLDFGVSPATLIRSQNSILLNDMPLIIGWNNNGTNTDLALTSLNECDENECTTDLGYTHIERTYLWTNLSVTTSPFNAFQDINFTSGDYEISTETLCQPICEVTMNVSTPSLICTNTEVSFTVTPITGTTIGNLEWQIGTQVYLNESTVDTTFINPGNVSYQLIVFDSTNTCSTLVTGILPILETPFISLPEVISICQFPTDTLFSFGQYNWLIGPMLVNPTNVNQEGIYTASITTSCGSSTDQTQIELIEVVNPIFLSDSILCPEDEFVTVTFPINSEVYLNSNQISSPYQIDEGGTYVFEYISPEGCSDIINTTIIDHSTIDEYILPIDTLFICSLPSNEFDQYYDDFTFYQDNINSPYSGTIESYGSFFVSPTTSCGVYQSEITVVDGNIDFSNFEDMYLLCENQTLEIDLLNYSYTIDNQSTSNPLILDTPGIYQVNTTNNECSNGISIEVISYDESLLLPSELCLKDAFDFNFLDIDSLGTWSFDNTNTINGAWLPELGENYIYHAGVCGDQVQVITVNPDFFCDCLAYVPNAFTPNNDEHNEIWEPIFSNAPYWFEYRIFNRWGEEIFINNNNKETVWMGDHISSGEYYCQNEVYSWILKYQCIDKAEITEKRGYVVVIR